MADEGEDDFEHAVETLSGILSLRSASSDVGPSTEDPEAYNLEEMTLGPEDGEAETNEGTVSADIRMDKAPPGSGPVILSHSP